MWFRIILPIVLTLFPLEVVAKLLVVTLRALSRKTVSTYDDDLVRVLENHFHVEPEVTKDEPIGRG